MIPLFYITIYCSKCKNESMIAIYRKHIEDFNYRCETCNSIYFIKAKRNAKTS